MQFTMVPDAQARRFPNIVLPKLWSRSLRLRGPGCPAFLILPPQQRRATMFSFFALDRPQAMAKSSPYSATSVCALPMRRAVGIAPCQLDPTLQLPPFEGDDPGRSVPSQRLRAQKRGRGLFRKEGKGPGAKQRAGMSGQSRRFTCFPSSSLQSIAAAAKERRTGARVLADAGIWLRRAHRHLQWWGPKGLSHRLGTPYINLSKHPMSKLSNTSPGSTGGPTSSVQQKP